MRSLVKGNRIAIRARVAVKVATCETLKHNLRQFRVREFRKQAAYLDQSK